MTITATYHAPEGDNAVVTTRGVRFFDGQPVELNTRDHAELLGKLKGNPHFELAGDVDGIETQKPAPLKAVHKGFGKFTIDKGDKVLVEGLDKAKADEFNALDDDAKAVFVQNALDDQAGGNS